MVSLDWTGDNGADACPNGVLARRSAVAGLYLKNNQ
jgi:hypothetical protein